MATVMSAAYRVLTVGPIRRVAGFVGRRLPAGMQRQLRRQLERHSVPASRKQTPALSIVIPVYNVEEYISSTLDSVLSQTLREWEAIVVNDGSTDRSAEIVQAYAAGDSRIRVMHQDNAGLGAARNTGIRAAAGAYLTFLDSDDLIPANAYKTAVQTLQKTGSDFAIGATQRIQGMKRYAPAWARHLHSRERRCVTADSLPEVMMDIIACNRIFKKSFWHKEIGEFPTDVAYEDHRVMVTAIIRAKSFDVLSTVTYLWRVRQDGGSISQQKMDLQNLVDRKQAHDDAFAILRAEASATAMSAWLTRILDLDVPLFAEHTAVADATYRGAAQEFAQQYAAHANTHIWAGVRWHQRVTTLLMAAGRWKDLEQFRIDLRGRAGVPGTVIDNAQVRLDMSRWGEPVNALLTGRDLLGGRHTRLYARVDHQEWTTEGLRLGGFAYLAHVDPDESAPVALKLVNQRTGALIAVPPAYPVHNDHVNAFANHQYFDYSAAGFSIVLDWRLLLSLFEAGSGTPSDSWELRADLTWHGVSRSAVVDTTLRHGSTSLLRSELAPEHAIFVVPTRVDGALHIEARRIYAALERFDLADERIAGLVAVPPRDGYLPVEIGSGTNVVPLHPSTEVSRSQTGWPTYTFDGFAPDRSEPDRLRVTFSNGIKRNLAWAMTSVDPQIRSPYAARRSPFGYVDILPAEQCRTICAVHFDNVAITVAVECGYDEAAQTPPFALHHSATNTILDPDHIEKKSEGVNSVTFDLNRRGPNGQALRGTYHLWAGNAPVVPGDDVLGTLPATTVTDYYRVDLLRAPASQGGAFMVAFGPPLEQQEQGPWAQAQLKEWFTTTKFDPEHAVLFQCYRGESATDSQRAIHEELRKRGTDLTLYWGVQDGTVAVPPQGVPVIIGSRQWYQLLGSVEYLCNNIDFDHFFFRREHQRFLQTFHGHPFKAMGKTYWQTVMKHGHLAAEHEARRRQQLWTSAIMPNSESAEYYKADYGLEHGRIVTGYPRIAPIVTADPAASREQIASAFDLTSTGNNWVLYAPTWREKSATGTWSATLFDSLDLPVLAGLLGPDWTILVRGHNHNAREDARIPRQESVIDVTDYPEINDLILAADAAVLDYSSLRFDWAITRKPMVFFVPDKEEYLRLRPGLFDFDESAPGRQVAATEGVAAALGQSDCYEKEYGEDLDAFNARFNPLSDGRAAARVVDNFFTPEHRDIKRGC